MAALAAGAAAAPDPSCQAACTGQPLECRSCPETNVLCDPVSDRGDHAAWQQCVDQNQQCKEASYTCYQGQLAGTRAAARCGGAASCCAEACSADLSPPHRSSPSWLYFDALVAPLMRAPGDHKLGLAVGGLVELLSGPSSWHGDRLPLRVGPFASLTANKRDGWGAQLAGGVTLLAGGHALPGGQSLASALLFSAGALYDAPRHAPDQLGALARVSYGITSTGQSRWKPISAFFFAEGHWIPGRGGVPGREEVLLGFRCEPLSALLLLIPNLDQ